MKKYNKLLSFLSIVSLISCSNNSVVIKSPAEDGGLEGNANSDVVEKLDTDAVYDLLVSASKIKKFSYEITSNVIGYESHSIMYYTPNAWYEECDDTSLSIGMAQTYKDKEVFYYYLSEDGKEVIPSIYEYFGLNGEMDKLTDLYSSLSTAHISMLNDTLDTFEAIYVSTNKFLITDSETASVFQYMTTYGSSITSYINGIYIEILDLNSTKFKVITDLGEAGTIECIFTDKTKEGTKIDFVNELIINSSLKGVDYHNDIYNLFTQKISSNNYVLEGTKLMGDSTIHRYNIYCTNDYFYLKYSDVYANQGYKGFGYTMVKKGTPITYLLNGEEVTQTLDYDACYSFKENDKGDFYFDRFIGPIESDELKFIELDSLEEINNPKTNIYYIVNNEGTKKAYEYKEITEGVYDITYVMDWFDSVADFPINEISASYYFTNNGLSSLAPMFYEQDLNNADLYHCKDKDVLSLLANGLFGWGFMSTTTWMDYITESRIEISKDEHGEIIGANVGLGINASVDGGEYKEQFVYYEVKDFGNGNIESVETFLNKYLGGE